MEKFDLATAFSPNPAIQQLIQLCRQAAAKEISKEDFAGQIEQSAETFNLVIAGLKQIAEKPQPEVVEFLPQMELQLGAYRQALERIGAFPDSDDATDLEQGVKELLIASGDLFNLSQAIELSRQEAPATITCVYCEEQNLLSEKFCRKCGKILPRPFTEARESRLEISEFAEQLSPGSLEILQKAGQAVQEGRISLEDFQQVLDAMGMLVRSVVEQYRLYQFPENQNPPEVPEGQALLEEAAAIYGQAVARLREYIKEPNPAFIEEGLKMAQLAEEKLARLQYLTAGKAE